MRCRVSFTYVYDKDGNLLKQKAEVIELLEIIHSSAQQGGLIFLRRTNGSGLMSSSAMVCSRCACGNLSCELSLETLA